MYWVFHKQQVESALAQYAKDLDAVGASEQKKNLIVGEVMLFLQSNAAIDAGMLIGGQHKPDSTWFAMNTTPERKDPAYSGPGFVSEPCVVVDELGREWPAKWMTSTGFCFDDAEPAMCDVAMVKWRYRDEVTSDEK